MTQKSYPDNFSEYEFACKCGCGYNDIHYDTLDFLDKLRKAIGQPISIVSGCRCESHNKNVGGAPNSKHCEGKAVDIICQPTSPRVLLLHCMALYPDCIQGIGISLGSSIIHLAVQDIPHLFYRQQVGHPYIFIQ